MALILAQQSRERTLDLQAKDEDGDVVSLGANDVVRVKIGRRRQTPILDLDSAANSANGSSITKNSPSANFARVLIHEDDMALLEPGTYSFEFAIYDNAARS